jgi:hypothetical protein
MSGAAPAPRRSPTSGRSPSVPPAVVARRLAAQQIARRAIVDPADLVRRLGAVQAQDYAGAKWALGLRLAGRATAAAARIERVLADGAIIRTHALRWTWHFVAPADVRWMVALVAPRLIARSATRHRQLALDATTFRRSNAAIEKALRDGAHLTRDELASALGAAGISTDGQRLAHLLARAELDAVICSGARRGKQATYALLDRRAPRPRTPLARDEALAELARRYFRTRGPATAADFAWWSGLSPSDARAGLASVSPDSDSEVAGGRTFWHAGEPPATAAALRTAYLLPPFDEYLVAYRDRSAVLAAKHAWRCNDGGGMLAPCVVLGGRVIGTWRRTIARAAVTIEIDLFEKPARNERELIAVAARRYGAHLGLEAELVFRTATMKR